ncbi:MAG: zinc ABC transporter solute-binding protein [Gammaproteobacteria bacterium]|nr:zinc ABC transporter solute-binding protein [Gammaproteobacteria bacterium]
MIRSGWGRFTILLLFLYGPWSLAGNGFQVVATIKPVHSLLAGLMQGVDGLHLLIGGERTPHDYQLSEQDREKLADASLVVWLGPDAEPYLKGVLDSESESHQALNLLELPGLKVLPARWDDQQNDPFFWLDTRNALILLDELTRFLMDADPGHAHLYLRNRKQVLPSLTKADRELEYGYRGLKAGVGVAYHDVLQYFEQAYALKVGELLAAPDGAADTASLLRARARIRDGEFRCILTSPPLPEYHLTLLTEGQQVVTGKLDIYGTQFSPGPDLYVKLIRYNTQVIRECTEYQSNAGTAEEKIEQSTGELGGRFILTDHRGHATTDADFTGHFSLLYFGYTYCPDVCPTTLQVIALALKMLEEQESARFKSYLITVDPERDKVEILNNYVSYFDFDLTGLTGSQTMIDRVVDQYRIKYQKVLEPGNDPDTYLIDHTASLVLLGTDGRFITRFAYGISPRQLAEKLKAYLP